MSFFRRFLFRAAAALLVLAVAEAASWIALAILAHGFATPRGFRYGRGAERDVSAAVPAGATELTAGMVPHPFLGFTQKPRRSNPATLALARFPTTEFGFNDVASPIRHRSKDRFLVGITGGSVAFFLSTRGDAELAARLEGLPALAGRKVEFVRLSQGGYKQPQQLMTLEYLLALGGELDALVNLDGFNDVALYPAEEAQEHTFPAYPRNWQTMLANLESLEAKKAIGKWAVYDELRERWSGTLSGPFLDHSALATLLWYSGDSWLATRIGWAAAVYRQEMASGPVKYAATGPKTTFASDAAMYSALADLWERASLTMDRTSRGYGILYFHFLQPNQYLPGAKPIGEAERAVAVNPASPTAASIGLGYPLLSAAGERLRANGVDFTDLSRLFAHVDEPLYIDDCCHLNQEGNRLLAVAIADRMAARLSAKARPGGDAATEK